MVTSDRNEIGDKIDIISPPSWDRGKYNRVRIHSPHVLMR